MSVYRSFLNHEEFATSIIGSKPRMYYICSLCDSKVHSSMMSRHLLKHHGLTPQSYYDLVVPESGKCVECGKKSNFECLSRGYFWFCSNRCQMTNRNRDPYFKELNRSIMVNNHNSQEFKRSLADSLSHWVGSPAHKKSCAKMVAARMSSQIKSDTINFYIARSPVYQGLKFGICEDLGRLRRFNGELVRRWIVPKQVGINLEIELKSILDQYGESFPEYRFPEIIKVIEELVNV